MKGPPDWKAWDMLEPTEEGSVSPQLTERTGGRKGWVKLGLLNGRRWGLEEGDGAGEGRPSSAGSPKSVQRRARKRG